MSDEEAPMEVQSTVPPEIPTDTVGEEVKTEVEIALTPLSLANVIAGVVSNTLGHADNHHAQNAARLPTIHVLVSTGDEKTNVAISLDFPECRVCQAAQLSITTTPELIN